jgi:hypothetical protein
MKGRLERSMRNNKGLRAKNAALGVQLKEKEALNNKLLLFLSSALTKIDDLKGIALLLLYFCFTTALLLLLFLSSALTKIDDLKGIALLLLYYCFTTALVLLLFLSSALTKIDDLKVLSLPPSLPLSLSLSLSPSLLSSLSPSRK